MGKTLTLHTGGNWAGYMPSFTRSEHECADDLDSLHVPVGRARPSPTRCPACPPARSSPPPASDQEPDAARLLGPQRAATPAPAPASTTRTWRSRTTSLRRAPTRASASSTSRTRRTRSQIVNYTGCNVGQGDVVVYGNILSARGTADRRSAQRRPAPASSSATGFEGIHIFDISDPAEPGDGPQLRMASTGNERRRADRLRLAHRDRRAGQGARLPLHLQRRLERHLHRHRHRPDQDLGPDRRRRSSSRVDARPRAAAPATTTTCCSTSAARPPATRCARAATASRCSSST